MTREARSAPRRVGPVQPPAASRARPQVHITLVGTNDLHGHLEALPTLAGYLRVIRAERARDHGGVVLVDAGDLFQGTLESNLLEGAPVIAAYNALGYTAVAIGNHDFDYGPRDDEPGATTPRDPRGALLARASEARFPLLNANLLVAASRARVAWPNVRPSVLVEVAGVRVGVVGVTTSATLATTMAANVHDLALQAPVDAIVEQARALRAQGAALVIAVAHAGGRCGDVAHPDASASCDATQEIDQIAAQLPPGLLDAIVAGHTHQAMANVVHGVPVIESYAMGRAFGRIDFTVDAEAPHAVTARIEPPRELCARPASAGQPCDPGVYDGQPVVADAQIAQVVAPALANARRFAQRPLGVNVVGTVHAAYDREAAMGNLLADLLRAGTPGADVAILNGGGVRAELREGPVTYGAMYEVMPFDNRVVTFEMRASDLQALVADNLGRTSSVVLLSGITATARCRRGRLEVALARANGRAVPPDALLRVATSDFLASGGDGYFDHRIARSIPNDAPPLLRDVLVEQLSARAGVVRGDDVRLFDPAHPRVAFPGERPVRCEATARP